MDDNWLWEHMPDLQMDLYDRLWRAIYRQNVSTSNDHSSTKDTRTEDEAKYIAGELVNLVAYSMGKEIAASSGNKAILRELQQYNSSVADNPDMRTHISDTQIKRAEKYGIIHYLAMKNNSLEEIADKTGLTAEAVNASLNSDLWILLYDSNL